MMVSPETYALLKAMTARKKEEPQLVDRIHPKTSTPMKVPRDIVLILFRRLKLTYASNTHFARAKWSVMRE